MFKKFIRKTAADGNPGGYVEDAFKARTQLGDFFNVRLIGVAYAASPYELQELGSGLRLTTESA